uniref:DUF1618 domain-containing protein n=1 Tax=Oryza meridionalis TaxID=40149 RepID=A0A0E0F9Q7_9ORYZ
MSKIWFIDLPLGLLFCDPFIEKPKLTYVALPEGCLMLVPDIRSRHNLEKRRCVKISQHKICYVQLDEGEACLWSLLYSESESPEWQLEYKAPLADIWGDKIYKTSGLTPGKVPAIAMIDPTDCAVLYFIEQDVLFSFDIRSKRVLMSKSLEMRTDFCPVESDNLPSNDLDEQSDSDDDEESDNEDDEDEEHGRQNSWVCAQEVISSGQAAWEYFESQLEAVQGNQDGEQ